MTIWDAIFIGAVVGFVIGASNTAVLLVIHCTGDER